MRTPRTALIIGAGVVGMASAYALARRGVAVTILDAMPGAGMGASYGNGRQLSYGYTDALASRDLLGKIPRLALGCDPAFRIYPRFDAVSIKWKLQFLRNCTERKFRQNSLNGLMLARKSRDAMAALLAKHDIEFGHRTAGKMLLFDNNAAFSRGRAIMYMKARHQERQMALTYDEATKIEPALNAVAHPVAGVIYSPTEQTGNAAVFADRLGDVVSREYGVSLRFNVVVTGIESDRNHAVVKMDSGDELQADIAIVCSGAAAGKLLRSTNIKAPIYPMKGYSFIAPATKASPQVSITDVVRKLVFTRIGDEMLIAGLADLGDDSADVRPERMADLIASAQAAFPEAADYRATRNHWSGLRPMTPNSLPIISRPSPTLAINAGHGMLGWTLAMGSGEKLAERIFAN
ncbi:FAD-dependent oxidoreductase [Parasphingorhabdus sp.]|uniref:FAD-dependent oxidoreductase n=1 Tax=Parasphingorhabdus sp. TaxID=2709688 RepID=UPI003A959583